MFPFSKFDKKDSREFYPNVNHEFEKTSTYKAYGDLQVNVDDSSDEEEVDSKIEGFSVNEQWAKFINEKYQDVLKCLEIQDDRQNKTAIFLSFIVNAIGTYLLYSPQITRAYYLDKSINLGNSQIAKRSEIWEGIKGIVRSAINSSLAVIVDESFKTVTDHELVDNIDSDETKVIVESILREAEKDMTTFAKLLSVNRELYKKDGIKSEVVKMNNELQLLIYNTADIANIKILDAAKRNNKGSSSVEDLLNESTEKYHRRRTRLNSVISRNIVRKSRHEIIDRDRLLTEVERKLVELLQRNQNNLMTNIKVRDTIDNNFQFQFYDYADMLVAVRLHNRSQKRTLRNTQQGLLNDRAIIPTIGTWNFRNGLSAQGCEVIKRSNYKRVNLTLAYAIRSYEGIRYEIEDLKEYYLPEEITRNYWDICIAMCIRSTVNGRGVLLLENSDVSKVAIRRIKDLIARLALTMFGYEAARCPSTIITHQMILDLIIDGKLTWREALDGKIKSPSKGGYLPMSMENAGNLCRNIYLNYYRHYMPYPYRFEGASTIYNVEHLVDFLHREGEIIDMWLENVSSEREEISELTLPTNIASVISSKAEAWWRNGLQLHLN
ncbi:uncharacterized protein TRIADDRAFT_59760 [Trichoplax adhaerens]|uniref:Uncharacterized protein n=1 Tax=Trichoplax adhaerens TaxID=10228 RepID=B3S6C8_TRIAD|nr:predicted protein [Trichoplax adhaerens]EDV21600.1 predicted protein [Trichoplax adhaerens]|eukprot:XP_002115748.1 predicted protein [Trichoplax adhaerens]